MTAVLEKKKATRKRASVSVKPTAALPTLVAELINLQRIRSRCISNRNAVANAIRSMVAQTLDYHIGLTKEERISKHEEAQKLIGAIRKGEITDHPVTGLVTNTRIEGLEEYQANIEKLMIPLAEQLPVASWVGLPEQRGFAIQSLATVVGEAGNLSGYDNPGKLWKRFGCAPFSAGDKTLMGGTWKSGCEGKLTAAEWEEFGYSPRRRSIAYLIGENLMKGNGEKKKETKEEKAARKKAKEPSVWLWKGPYRLRYEESRAKVAAAHPDYPKLRCHRHGMLLAAKLLLKNLWIEWKRPSGWPAKGSD